MANPRRPRDLPQGRDPLADVADLPFFTGSKKRDATPTDHRTSPASPANAASDASKEEPPPSPSNTNDSDEEQFDIYAAMRKISRKATFDLSEEADDVLFHCTRVLQDSVGRQFWAKEKDVLNLLLIFAGRCVRNASFQEAAREYSGATTEKSAEIFEHLWNALLKSVDVNK